MTAEETVKIAKSFNPCFNGTMYKNFFTYGKEPYGC